MFLNQQFYLRKSEWKHSSGENQILNELQIWYFRKCFSTFDFKLCLFKSKHFFSIFYGLFFLHTRFEVNSTKLIPLCKPYSAVLFVASCLPAEMFRFLWMLLLAILRFSWRMIAHVIVVAGWLIDWLLKRTINSSIVSWSIVMLLYCFKIALNRKWKCIVVIIFILLIYSFIIPCSKVKPQCVDYLIYLFQPFCLHRSQTDTISLRVVIIKWKWNNILSSKLFAVVCLSASDRN